MDKILLIDGHNAIWRANFSFGKKEHALDEKTSSCICGNVWNVEKASCDLDYTVIYNFFRSLRPLIEDFEPSKCFFALEGHPQFRYDLYPEYKANRLIKQASKKEVLLKFFKDRDAIVSLMQHLPITTARAENYEADDTIATLCDNIKEENLVIISTDTDFIQLLQKGYSNINLYNPVKKEFVQPPPYPYVAWKCLAGDKSDNIPSLLKPKKALNTASNPELFKDFMEIEENRANFSINHQLIEFKKIPIEEIVLREGVKDFTLLKNKFTEMKFESIVNDKSWVKFTQTFDCIKF